MTRNELTECMRTHQHVIFRDTEYIPQAYILRLVKDQWLHSAELKELKANCVVIADLERITKHETIRK